MEEPIPQVRRVTQLERIRERGATVVYRKPKWKEAEGDEKPVRRSFVYPADRSPGSSVGKVRRRRPRSYKTIKYTLP